MLLEEQSVRPLTPPRAALNDAFIVLNAGRDRVLFAGGSPDEIVRRHEVDVLIAGGRNMYTALKARIPFLDINQERDFGYEGYQGMVELARQLTLTLNSPVWEAVRTPPP